MRGILWRSDNSREHELILFLENYGIPQVLEVYMAALS